MVGGAVAGAALAGGSPAMAGTRPVSTADEDVSEGSDVLGVVVDDASSNGGRIAVQVGEEVRVVAPVMFPVGWQVASGDRVTVNLDRNEAYPLVEMGVAANSRGDTLFSTVNENAGSERVIATYRR